MGCNLTTADESSVQNTNNKNATVEGRRAEGGSARTKGFLLSASQQHITSSFSAQHSSSASLVSFSPGRSPNGSLLLDDMAAYSIHSSMDYTFCGGLGLVSVGTMSSTGDIPQYRRPSSRDLHGSLTWTAGGGSGSGGGARSSLCFSSDGGAGDGAVRQMGPLVKNPLLPGGPRGSPTPGTTNRVGRGQRTRSTSPPPMAGVKEETEGRHTAGVSFPLVSEPTSVLDLSSGGEMLVSPSGHSSRIELSPKAMLVSVASTTSGGGGGGGGGNPLPVVVHPLLVLPHDATSSDFGFHVWDSGEGYTREEPDWPLWWMDFSPETTDFEYDGEELKAYFAPANDAVVKRCHTWMDKCGRACLRQKAVGGRIQQKQ